jgi:hypothetical protein
MGRWLGAEKQKKQHFFDVLYELFLNALIFACK